MAEKTFSLQVPEVAKPVHIQRLEKALDLGPLLSYAEQANSAQVNEDDANSTDDEYDQSLNSCEEISIGNADVQLDKSKLYNFSNVGPDRQWLQDMLLQTDSSEESAAEVTHEDYQQLLKFHVHDRKHRKKYYTNKDVSLFVIAGGLIDYTLISMK